MPLAHGIVSDWHRPFDDYYQGRLVLPPEAKVYKSKRSSKRRSELAPHQKNRIGIDENGIKFYWTGRCWLQVLNTMPLHERFPSLNCGD